MTRKYSKIRKFLEIVSRSIILREHDPIFRKIELSWKMFKFKFWRSFEPISVYDQKVYDPALVYDHHLNYYTIPKLLYDPYWFSGTESIQSWLKVFCPWSNTYHPMIVFRPKSHSNRNSCKAKDRILLDKDCTISFWWISIFDRILSVQQSYIFSKSFV